MSRSLPPLSPRFLTSSVWPFHLDGKAADVPFISGKNRACFAAAANGARLPANNKSPGSDAGGREGGRVRSVRATRRKFLSLSAGAAVATSIGLRGTLAGDSDVIRFGLTPVLLTSDLNLL